MSLTAITIENFKGISSPVTVPLRPITLLFGANSAGKSTIIQAMQYAWEVLENRNPDVDRTRLGGETIDLGGFCNLVHQHDLSREIRITLEFDGPIQKCEDRYLPPDIFWSEIEDRLLAWEGGSDASEFLNIKSFGITLATCWDEVEDTALVSLYEVHLNGAWFGRIEPNEDRAPRLVLNTDHEFFDIDDEEGSESSISEYGYGVMEEIRSRSKIQRLTDDEIEQSAREAVEKLGAERVIEIINAVDLAPPELSLVHYSVDSLIPEWGQRLSPRREKDGSSPAEDAVWVMTQLLVEPGDSIRGLLGKLRYLGPLRDVPNRSHDIPLRPGPERWANGLGAWDTLLRSEDSDREVSSLTLVEKCSRHLNETLDMPYTIRRETLYQVAESGDVHNRIKLLAARFEEMEQSDAIRLLSQFENLRKLPKLQLRDEKIGIDVEPIDIGVGVSQVIPVIVGVTDKRYSVFAVEQPELHVHPAVQVRLADVILREILESRSSSKAGMAMIETHSEHLILRIMRRMRQTVEGTLPEGFPRVVPDDVAVLYVETHDSRLLVREMPLNERGELIKAWPGGFFEEGLRETLD